MEHLNGEGGGGIEGGKNRKSEEARVKLTRTAMIRDKSKCMSKNGEVDSEKKKCYSTQHDFIKLKN